jgi:hypothetical protein
MGGSGADVAFFMGSGGLGNTPGSGELIGVAAPENSGSCCMVITDHLRRRNMSATVPMKAMKLDSKTNQCQRGEEVGGGECCIIVRIA